MRADLFETVIEGHTYRVEEPLLDNGLKATVTVFHADGHTLHSDRINLDRDPVRERFAKKAGSPPADLLTVRDTVLAALTPPTVAAAPPPPPIAQDDEAALALLDAPDLLARVAATVAAQGYAGAAWPILITFLVLNSRLLKRPINLVVGGPSSAGKSFLVATVAKLCPDDATYFLSGMSDRVLVYTDADLRHRMLIIGEASALQQEGIGASLLRNLAWEGRLVYETVEKTGEGMQARRIEKEGPTGFITTTTGQVEPELETRVLTITVDDTPEATRTIIAATARRATGQEPAAPDLDPWHDMQRWLAAHGEREVAIPFAPALGAGVPTALVRMRRDFPQLLTLVQAHALLHQRQRARDDHGRIVAARADYEAVYAIAAPVFGAIAAEGVTPALRELVVAVAAACRPTNGTVGLTALAAHLGLDKSSVSRRVAQAIKGGWLVNDEMRRGYAAKLRPGEPLPEDRPALPSPDDVFAAHGAQHRNTPPAHALLPSNGAPETVARGDATPAQPPQGVREQAEGGGGTVAVPLHAPTQRSFLNDTDENEGDAGEHCGVALAVAVAEAEGEGVWRG